MESEKVAVRRAPFHAARMTAGHRFCSRVLVWALWVVLCVLPGVRKQDSAHHPVIRFGGVAAIAGAGIFSGRKRDSLSNSVELWARRKCRTQSCLYCYLFEEAWNHSVD
eukprot:IDg2276t1